MATGEDPSDARLASDRRGASAQSKAVEAYLLIADSTKISVSTRLSAAEKIVPLDQRAAARAFHAIAGSTGVDTGSRIRAAERIIPLDSRLAVEALVGLAGSTGVDIGSKISAAERMIPLDPGLAVKTLAGLAATGITVVQQIQVAKLLAPVDSGPAATILKKLVAAYRPASPDRAVGMDRDRFNMIIAAVDNLAKFEPRAVIDILCDLVALPIADEFRLSAADRIAELESRS